MTTNDVSDTRISDERLEYLRDRVNEAKSNGDPEKYMAFITVKQAHEIGIALTELLASRTQSPAEWHLGAQNDGLFIIDTPPRPSNDDQWHDRPDGPSLVIPLGGMNKDLAQQIVNAHNAILRAASIPPPERSKEETGVRVRPLVWRVPTDHPRDPDIEDNALCADGVGGVYAISKKQKVGPERLLWMADDPFDWKGYGSIPEAKAAAQADYEQRVLSAIETPPLHKEGEAVYFADGNTVRKRVGSAFGEGDVLFCTPSAWFPANEVADLLNAAPVPVPVTITVDEVERIILETEPAQLSDKGDKIWTRRMATALAARLSALSAKPGEQG